MHVLQAGNQKYLFLELEAELVTRVANQCGFACKVEEHPRSLIADLSMEGRKAPLLLFDAADSANLGWFSRCQFYVDGQTGAVLQTPISIANLKDRDGETLPNSIRLQIAKELPENFRFPGRQAVTEQTMYSVLAGLLHALAESGVGVCGGSVVRPLAGRTDSIGLKS